MSAPPLVSIPVGVVVERRKADEPVDRLRLAAGRGAGRRAGRRAPWTVLRDDGDAHDVLCRHRPSIELHRTETANYRDNLATGAPSLWVVLRADRSRAALRASHRDRRSGRGRGA